MKNNVKILKLFAYIFVLVEVVGLAIFAVFYFADLYDVKGLITPENLTLGSLILIGINILILWLVIVSVTGVRYRTDLRAAEIIGEDVQEAYNFAMIGLAVTD